MSYGGDSGDGSNSLATVSQDGTVPETRFSSAQAVQDFGRRLWDQDIKRSRKRAKVNGLIGGFPPYSAQKLREAGRSDSTNANFGTARSYVEAAVSAFYDLSHETSGHFVINTSHGNDEQRIDWSRAMSESADLMLDSDKTWDYDEQQMLWQMVVHSPGVMFFEDSFKVLPRSVPTGSLKVPERALSDRSYWDAAFIDLDQYPPQLYTPLRDEKFAEAVGWNVKFSMGVLANAMDVRSSDGRQMNAEWCAQEMKNNSFNYIDDQKVVKLYHAFWLEFDGSITHAIVERESTTSNAAEYLFHRRGRYSNWDNALHTFYFDRGDNGFHHSATGLGVKCYSAMEEENRMLCNLYDKAKAPKIFFKPGNAESKEKFQVARFGDWGLLPPGTDFIQNPIQGYLTDGLAMFRTSSDLMRSNLSQYRQTVKPDRAGNPATAFEERMNASEQGALSNTTFSRHYKQLDMLYAEIARRLCNLNSTDQRAKEFQARCMKQGVPRECFGRIESVRAVRVVGSGSPFMRQETTQSLQLVVNRLPDEGQQHWLNDFIASRGGQSAVERYNPTRKRKMLPSDQTFEATEGVVMAKNGISPPVTNSQRPSIFAVTYLKAAADALNSVSQGANPVQVLQFVQALGPAIAAHLQRLQGDPLSKDLYGMLEQRMKKLASLADRLKKVVQQQAQKAKQQKAKTQGALTDEQLATQKLMGDERRKNAKLKFQIQRDAAKTKHSLRTSEINTKAQIALADARTASDISNAHRKSLAALKE